MNTKSNILRVLLLLWTFSFSSQSFAVQNLPQRNTQNRGAGTELALDRLTLSLVDRLPTDAERDYVRIHGKLGAFDLANQLIKSKEFFDRQSQYWQSQLIQTPAWLWEMREGSPWNKLFSFDSNARSRPIYFFPPRDPARVENVCTGVWTVLEGQTPQLCSCDETADAVPYWDSSSSMRVCPIVKKEEYCGSHLQNCIPVDARLQNSAQKLDTDQESAGGRAISRLIADLSLIQGRSLAFAVVTQQKWRQLAQPNRPLLSKSSIELLDKWKTHNPQSALAQVTAVLQLESMNQSAQSFFSHQIVSQRERRRTRLMTESPAEELFVGPVLEFPLSLRPLQSTHLSPSVWVWNTHLLMNCQVPHIAPQVFKLPLPRPEQAREGAYFCASCHLSLDKKKVDLSQQKITIFEKNLLANTMNSPHASDCAVDHALQFLLGYRPTGSDQDELRTQGKRIFSKNAEVFAATLRDLALQLALQGGSQ